MSEFRRKQRVGNRRALNMGSLATIATYDPGGLDSFREEIRDSAKNYTLNSNLVNRRFEKPTDRAKSENTAS